MMTSANGHEVTAADAGLQVALGELNAVLDRVRYASRLGMQYDGLRDSYEALGFRKVLSFADYAVKYDREDIAGTIVRAGPDACWRELPVITDDEDPDVETPFDLALRDLDERVQLFSALRHLDVISGIGRFGVMYLGLSDGQDPKQPIRRRRRDAQAPAGRLAYVSAFSEGAADIRELNKDRRNARYGLPELYRLTVEHLMAQTAATGIGRTVQAVAETDRFDVHHSRIVHVAEDRDQSRIYGRPRLHRVFNLLQSLFRITHWPAELAWRSGGLHADVRGDLDPDEVSPKTTEAIAQAEEKIAAFPHGS